MAAKKLAEFTKQELINQKKSLRNILIIMGVLVFLFILYLVYTMLAGTWKSANLGGVVAIIILGSLLITKIIKIGRINTELERRKDD